MSVLGLCEDPHDSAHVSVRGTLSPAPSDVTILEKEQLRPRATQAAKGKVTPGWALPPLPPPLDITEARGLGVRSPGRGGRTEKAGGSTALGPGDSHLGCRESLHLLSVSGSSLASRSCILPSSGRMKGALPSLVYLSSTAVQAAPRPGSKAFPGPQWSSWAPPLSCSRSRGTLTYKYGWDQRASSTGLEVEGQVRGLWCKGCRRLTLLPWSLSGGDPPHTSSPPRASRDGPARFAHIPGQVGRPLWTGVSPRVWIGRGDMKQTWLIVLREKPTGTGQGKGETG